jgi:ribose 5-phosphate isomerase B
MTIYLGADHGGFELKNQLKAWLIEQGRQVEDCGALAFDPADDYPDYAFAVAKKVAANPGSLGILSCRSGAGMVIAANKVSGIRAANAVSVQDTKFNRDHDDINVIAISGNWMQIEQAKEIVQVFLDTAFSQVERHVKRLAKIANFKN